ncbi:MAG: transketolase [Bacteroidetes bacterium GWE2_29_8]|nr:MAG: transketolase [Bacteroidetes bacterium GWE2_29_8]
MEEKSNISIDEFKNEILNDYKLAFTSRQASILGRREVLTGKAKFGLFGDGKEIAQIAMAKSFKNGDFRSGYYRDQTFMMAIGELTLEQFFAQLYGDTNVNANPDNRGRMMNNHFASRLIDEKGEWEKQTNRKNSSADMSPTAGQMPRLLGLGLASKIYREENVLKDMTRFSVNGNEVAFGTIGDASTSEGHFWETINAMAVLQVPIAMSVWDDGYGISVPKKLQTAKQSISEILKGFEIEQEGDKGINIYTAKAWDYKSLREMYKQGIEKCREKHIPCVFHITEATQPLGHSTSGSHERYKSKDRLEWEEANDCIKKLRGWIIFNGVASAEEIIEKETQAIDEVKKAKQIAWENFRTPLLEIRKELIDIIENSNCKCPKFNKIEEIKTELKRVQDPIRKDSIAAARQILRFVCQKCNPNKSLKQGVLEWVKKEMNNGAKIYSSFLYDESDKSPLKIKEVKPSYNEKSVEVTGREVLLHNWDYILETNPKVLIFGEDVGFLGGVNQTYEGLQAKYGELRVSDTGIREATIIGQGIGLALRGLRPVAEIQYFDYLLYGLQTLSDDLATLHYRTAGGQKAPLIISTRGHRLEGIWHSGSPLSMVINSIRGIHVLVPRNMTEAAGFYNTVLQGEDPALIIEPLNGYRIKEKLPENIGNFYTPLGIPEIITEGSDVTIVTYGSCVRIALEAVMQLKESGINCELIDIRSLLPFDISNTILGSIKKTNKVLFFDEDVPGGATSYMMSIVLEQREAFKYLDTMPRTLTGKEHRSAYTTDGDYFSNPNAEDVFDTVYSIMTDVNPLKFPPIY